jgi:hypothetical protein
MSENVGQIVVLGAVSVTYNGIELGHTTPNTKVTFKPKYIKAKTGKWGDTTTNIYRAGIAVEVALELLQTDLVNIQGSTTGSPYPFFNGIFGTNNKLGFGEVAGVLQTKALLKLTSFISGNTPLYDLTLTQATPIGAPEIDYTGEKEQIWKVTFEACIDEGQVAGLNIGSFGNSAATQSVVAPTVTSVVPAANATAISRSTVITWTMSEALNGNTVNASSVKLFSLTAGIGTPVACAAPVLTNNGASTTIALTPSGNLAATTAHIAVLNSTILDSYGNALALYSTQFTTGS